MQNELIHQSKETSPMALQQPNNPPLLTIVEAPKPPADVNQKVHSYVGVKVHK